MSREGSFVDDVWAVRGPSDSPAWPVFLSPFSESSRSTERVRPRGRRGTGAVTAAEFEQVREAVRSYSQGDGHSGPEPGRLLLAFVEVMTATRGTT